MVKEDWLCPNSECKNINFSYRTSCNRCGTDKLQPPKPTITNTMGKEGADKSGGLFNADDWICSKCGNVNWARRNTCNICNNPKFNPDEPRTGAGGGYKENDNIEYVRRSTDGEFDEFGRRKGKCKPVQSHDLVEEGSDDQNRDDDDEEEDDDDDVSNYVLDAPDPDKKEPSPSSPKRKASKKRTQPQSSSESNSYESSSSSEESSEDSTSQESEDESDSDSGTHSKSPEKSNRSISPVVKRRRTH